MTPTVGHFVRHEIAYSWCRIVAISGGSIVTRCNGRMAVRDTYDLEESPPIHERCGACVAPIEAGLRELVDATTQPVTFVEFEMVDDRFDDGGAQ